MRGRLTSIDKIFKDGQEVAQVVAGEVASCLLSDRKKAERGEIFVPSSTEARVVDFAKAHLCWFDSVPLSEGATFELRFATEQRVARIVGIQEIFDFARGEFVAGTRHVEINGIARVDIALNQPIFMDRRARSPLHRMVLIDAVTRTTVAAGVFTQSV